MSSKPDISIVIPCYNQGVYLDECIKSIHFPKLNVEIIIVDDGSTDAETISILNELKKNQKLHIINKPNKGISSARNTGIENAKADYIIPLDSDDILESSYFEKAFHFLKSNNCVDIIFGDRKHFGREDKLWKTNWDKRQQLYVNQVSNTAIYRKLVWMENKGYDESMNKGYEDWEFWVNSISNGFKFKHMSGISFHYRIKKYSTNTEAIKKHQELLDYIWSKHSTYIRAEFINMNNEYKGFSNDLKKLLSQAFKVLKRVLLNES